MRDFRRFFAVCALIGSLSIVALADGGITQTPGGHIAAQPPAPAISVEGTTAPSADTSTDTLTWLTSFVTWMGGSIF